MYVLLIIQKKTAFSFYLQIFCVLVELNKEELVRFCQECCSQHHVEVEMESHPIFPMVQLLPPKFIIVVLTFFYQVIVRLLIITFQDDLVQHIKIQLG